MEGREGREIIKIWLTISLESKYWAKLTSKLVSAEVLSAGLHLTRPVEGHRHGGHQVEVAAVLGVADLDGDGDVVVTEENWVLLSVDPNILTQAAPKENKISALKWNSWIVVSESWRFNKSFKLK